MPNRNPPTAMSAVMTGMASRTGDRTWRFATSLDSFSYSLALIASSIFSGGGEELGMLQLRAKGKGHPGALLPLGWRKASEILANAARRGRHGHSEPLAAAGRAKGRVIEQGFGGR